MPLTDILPGPFTSRRAGTGRQDALTLGLLLGAAVLLPASLASAVSPRLIQGEIRVHVSPDTTSLRPLKDPASITIKLEGTDGTPGAPVDLSIRLTAPSSGNFVSTDFPLIEGTRLVEMNLPNVSGTLSWDYIFPIRGEYRLEVTATDAQGRRLERSFALQVRESRAKAAFLAGFVAALFLLGFVAGRVFSGPAAVAAVVLVTALLYGAGSNKDLAADTGQTAGLKGELTVAPPRVGTLSIIRWRGTEPGSENPVPATVTLRVLQLEKGKEIFTLRRVPTDGVLDLALQFTDASPHRVVAAAAVRGRQQTEVTRTVEVESPTPPFGIRAWPVLLFSLVVLAGLAAGRFSKRHRLPLPSVLSG